MTNKRDGTQRPSSATAQRTAKRRPAEGVAAKDAVPSAQARATPASTGKSRTSSPTRAKRTTSTANGQRPSKASPPRGREEIVESIIDATLSMWATEGPAALSLRGIAARAGVNYGLVHRHFRTKEAVIRAAMDRVVVRSVQFIEGSEDLVEAMDRVLPPSTGAHARLLAWSVLQYYVDDVLPSEDRFLTRLCELAAADVDASQPNAATVAKVKAGSMLATLYGWKLFEPYLVRGLGLEELSSEELSDLVRQNVMKVISE